ncbi:MAG: alkaline phosphatase family protein, partial [bacterium]
MISKSSLAAFASGIIILSAGFECLVEPQVAQAVERESVRLSPREIFRRTASQWSGDIFLLPKYGNTTLETWEFDPKHWQVSTIAGRKLPPHPMTMHGIAWDYDLEIPIVFFDPTNKYFKSGFFKKLAVQQDIVPTLAAVLGVPAPAKKGGRVLTEALQKINIGQNDGPRGLPKAILVLIQDQVGRHYLAAHPDRAPFYDRLQKHGANFLNASVAHVDVETSVGHASIGTGSWPAEHGVAGNRFFHSGFWRQLSSFTIELSGLESARKKNPSLFFVPTLSDIWSVARAGKPVVLSVAPVARAAISVGGHGGLFVGGSKSYVTWTEENGGDGTWVTEPENYRMPESFKNKPALPWVKDFLGQSKLWRGHALISDDGKVDSRNL